MYKSLRSILFLPLVLIAMCCYSQAPTIASFSPATGPVGTLVTINGTNLSTPTAFTIGGQSAIAVSNTGSVLVGMVMPNAATGTVSITTAGGTASGTGNFTVTATKYPSVQQGSKLVGTGSTGTKIFQGSSVSVSADGNTAIVGGKGDNTNIGAAWVYTRSGGTWTQQGAKLLATDAVGAAQQGIAVALSADGNTAIIGGNDDNSNAGAAWIFTRSGGVWTQQGSKLAGTGSVGAAQQGFSVSMSADGNTAIVGGSADNSNAGAAWIFTRSAGAWTQQGSKLVGSGSVGAAQQGSSVSMSADGNTVIVGGLADNSNAGAAWVYTRSGGAWTQQGSKLVGTGNLGAAQQGIAVSLSADGNTALIGGAADEGGPDGLDGAAWVFTRSGGAWAQQGSKLVGTGDDPEPAQGCAVSLSADGYAAIVGGCSNSGGAWIYSRVGSAWTQQGNEIVGTGTSGDVGDAQQGHSVSMSADGNTAMEGGLEDNFGVGAAWVFISGLTENPPTVQATAVTFTNTTGTGTTVNWTNGNGASRVVFITSESPEQPATPVPENGTSYTANAVYGEGGQFQTGEQEWFCIYNGSGSTVNVTNLSIGTTYRIVVFEYNAITGYQEYLTTTSTGNPTNFTTISSNASLSSIALTPSSILTTTGTTGNTTTYTAPVKGATASVTVTPTAVDPTATITVDGVAVASGTASQPIAIAPGATITINTVVTAQDGTTTRIYSINATRLSDNAVLSSIKLTPAAVLTNTGTSGTTTTYNATVNIEITDVTITPTKVDANATIKVNGAAVASGTASAPITLSGGQTTINTVVTAQDGTTHTYSVNVIRLSNNAVLSSIKLTPASSLTNTGTSGTTTTYTTTANSATASVKVTPTAVDPNATIKVNGVAVASGTLSGAIAIAVGHTTITILVTAQDKSTRTYSITVTRLSNNALLSSIKLTPASTLTNTGTSNGTTTFSTSVPNSETSVKLTPTTADGSATVKVNGIAVASGTASGSIALAVGSNTINTIVTAQDGTTFRYTITATRASGPLHDLYEPISVVQPTEIVNIQNDGVMVHQGVSPNGDGVNDFLTIDGIIAYPDNSLQIIDRSGTLIYQAKGYNNVSRVFDGHSGTNGRMQQPGTYFYALDYVADGQNKHKTGYIILKY